MSGPGNTLSYFHPHTHKDIHPPNYTLTEGWHSSLFHQAVPARLTSFFGECSTENELQNSISLACFSTASWNTVRICVTEDDCVNFESVRGAGLWTERLTYFLTFFTSDLSRGSSVPALVHPQLHPQLWPGSQGLYWDELSWVKTSWVTAWAQGRHRAPPPPPPKPGRGMAGWRPVLTPCHPSSPQTGI